MRVEIDAWYVTLPVPMGSCQAAPPSPAPAADADACVDRVEQRNLGSAAALGFPVKSATVTTIGEGDKAVTMTVAQEVENLEVAGLDAALFDVPPDFVEVRSREELVPALAAGGSMSDLVFGSTADGTSEAAPKATGAIRVGVLEPTNQASRSLPMGSMRQDFAAAFNKAPYEALPLRGASPEEAAADAARLGCDFILAAEIVEAKTSKPGRLRGALRRVSGDAPSDVHEVRLEYKLFAVTAAAGAPVASGSARASSGGFGLRSALRLAAFAGRIYFTMVMMGGMGFMDQMSFLSNSGGGAMGGGLFDPRLSAISMALDLGTDIGGASTDFELHETVREALGNAARAAMESLEEKSN